MHIFISIQVACAFAFLAASPIVIAMPGPKQPQQTEEQRQESMEAKLRASSLEIDRDCQPSLIKRAYLAAAPVAARHWFWRGQRYAITSEVKAAYSAAQARAVSNRADRQIEMIEAKRDAALGIPQAAISPEMTRELALTDKLIANTEAGLLASTVAWARKCGEVAESQISRAEGEMR
jgi:hypothetical protein